MKIQTVSPYQYIRIFAFTYVFIIIAYFVQSITQYLIPVLGQSYHILIIGLPISILFALLWPSIVLIQPLKNRKLSIVTIIIVFTSVLTLFLSFNYYAPQLISMGSVENKLTYINEYNGFACLKKQFHNLVSKNSNFYIADKSAVNYQLIAEVSALWATPTSNITESTSILTLNAVQNGCNGLTLNKTNND